MKTGERPHYVGCLFLILLALAWQLTSVEKIIPINNFPTPGQVGEVFITQYGELAVQLTHTIYRAGFGLLLAILVAIPIGIAIARIKLLADLLEPVIEILRPLPTPAIIPLVMLIAGIGELPKVFVVFFAASFPILLNTIDGVRGIDTMLPLTAKSLRLSPRESFLLVDLPAASPQIMAGIRISVAISFMVAITSEMLLSTDGMGVYLMTSQQRFELTNEIAGIIVVATTAWAINWLYLIAEYRLLHWHRATTTEVHKAE